MIGIALHRTLSRNIPCSDVRQWGQGDISHGLRDKSDDVRRAHEVGWVELSRRVSRYHTGASGGNTNEIKDRNAIALTGTLVLPS